MAVDDGFHGTNHESLPAADIDLSCKDSSPQVNPEVVVDIKQDVEAEDLAEPAENVISDLTGFEIEAGQQFETTEEQWVRIPVTKVEEWINKDGPADMTRTAKVEFPFEWGGEGVIDYINGFDSQNEIEDQQDPYDECRIFFWDEDLKEWVVAHYGYVGGVGPSSATNGLGKFWVYDPADLMKGIQVSKNWANPSLNKVINFAISGVDNKGNDVGLEKRAVFDNVEVAILGAQGIPDTKEQNIQRFEPTVGDETFLIDLPLIGAFKLPIISGVLDIVTDFFDEAGLTGQKRFQINRNNMIDHIEWVTSLIDARWWFEPSPNGPVLTIDATAFKEGAGRNAYDRRYFVDEAVTDEFADNIQEPALKEAIDEFLSEEPVEEFNSGAEEDAITRTPATLNFGGSTTEYLQGQAGQVIQNDYLPPHKFEKFAEVDTLNNEALVDIKPFNTLTLYGESTSYRERYSQFGTQGSTLLIGDVQASTDATNVQDFQQAASAGGYTEEYPYVEVTYEPLVRRAGGYEYSSSPIESDTQYLNTARAEAVKEFRNHLAEETEGSMQIRGEPHIMPYDYIYTVPTCNDTYVNAGAVPITWEINGVKHTREAGERFKTELGVSLAVHERELDIQAEYQEA